MQHGTGAAMPSSRACADGHHDRCNGWWHVFGWKQDMCLCPCHAAPEAQSYPDVPLVGSLAHQLSGVVVLHQATDNAPVDLCSDLIGQIFRSLEHAGIDPYRTETVPGALADVAGYAANEDGS